MPVQDVRRRLVLIVLPVLERELERGNSGVKSYEIDNQKQEVKQIITQNVETMLDREEKTGGDASSMFIKKARTLKRFTLNNQVTIVASPGSP